MSQAETAHATTRGALASRGEVAPAARQGRRLEEAGIGGEEGFEEEVKPLRPVQISYAEPTTREPTRGPIVHGLVLLLGVLIGGLILMGCCVYLMLTHG